MTADELKQWREHALKEIKMIEAPGIYAPNPHKILELLDIVEAGREMAEFYAHPKFSNEDFKEGELCEFGCGCCAGIATLQGDDILIEYDESIVGTTARDFLAKYFEEAK